MKNIDIEKTINGLDHFTTAEVFNLLTKIDINKDSANNNPRLYKLLFIKTQTTSLESYDFRDMVCLKNFQDLCAVIYPELVNFKG